MTIRRTHNVDQVRHPARAHAGVQCSGEGHHVSMSWHKVGVGTTHDTVALDQRADSRLGTLLNIRSYILLPIAIDIGPKFIL